MASPIANMPPPGGPPPFEQKGGPGIGLGSQAVIGVKIGAAILGILVLVWYIIFLSYTDSPFWMVGIIVGVVGLGLGIAGIFIGNIQITKKRRNIPTLNIIFIILSIIFLFAMPILSSWEDPRTIGEELWQFDLMLKVLVFAVFVLCYIELVHASLRFSEINEYATSHNIKEFNVNSVIGNYFMWFAILIAIVAAITLLVLLLQIFLSGAIQDAAPQFGFSLEYNSIYSILISIAMVFIPIGIILSFVFGFFFKSRRAIVVKSKEDIVARRPEAVKMIK
jgi:hypothetical protein